jgi:hypothetical protein
MWKESLRLVKTTFPLLTAMILCSATVLAQPNVTNQKDNTHPEVNTISTSPAFIAFFRAARFNGYNDIEWTALAEQDTRKYIIEYSINGVDYTSAGELMAGQGSYHLKHNLSDERPLLYRVKAEQLNGKYFYSASIILKGIPDEPVKIYPTIITGSIVNVIAQWPVEKISIYSEGGAQVLIKDMGGKTDRMTVGLPGLGKGLYFITFYGREWKSTSKFIIP